MWLPFFPGAQRLAFHPSCRQNLPSPTNSLSLIVATCTPTLLLPSIQNSNRLYSLILESSCESACGTSISMSNTSSYRRPTEQSQHRSFGFWGRPFIHGDNCLFQVNTPTYTINIKASYTYPTQPCTLTSGGGGISKHAH